MARSIKVLGTGCLKCQKLFDNTTEAMKHLGIDEEFEMITNVNEIIAYGVTVTPALVINDMVWTSGDVPSVNEIKEIFRKQEKIT